MHTRTSKMSRGDFPLRNLELKGYRVLKHKYLELNLESEDGRAIVKVDGATGDVLDYRIEITPERVKEIVAGRYPNFTITSIEEADAEYIVSAEDEKHEVKIPWARTESSLRRFTGFSNGSWRRNLPRRRLRKSMRRQSSRGLNSTSTGRSNLRGD